MAALAVALILILLTAVSVALFWGGVGWLPVDISVNGPALDHQFTLTLLMSGALFVMAQLALAYLVWRYRERADGKRAHGRSGNRKLEAAWTLAVTVLFVGLGSIGYRLWAAMYLSAAPSDSVRIEVQGEQFAYSFRYPGPDGRFGATHPELINDAAGNPFGLDRQRDRDAQDDVVTATLGIPVDRPVELLLRSRDMVHSFYVRELRIQQDLLPGTEIPLHFIATRTGEYEIVCTQLCGLGHYRMRAFLKVMTEPDYQNWLRSRAAAQ
ncbi:MAG TPA: cytochrome c oxidase subunit II [Terriglobia bacterium]|nr:cytochrome c oxidase subunit II [Terriglobia bacterium]